MSVLLLQKLGAGVHIATAELWDTNTDGAHLPRLSFRPRPLPPRRRPRHSAPRRAPTRGGAAPRGPLPGRTAPTLRAAGVAAGKFTVHWENPTIVVLATVYWTAN